MNHLLPLSIGIGLAVSLLCTEFFGLAAGGMIVPGYFALSLRHPGHIGATLMAALLTYFIVQAMASVMIIYGRRRTTLMILVGYLTGVALRALPLYGHDTDSLAVVGYIIPGLIAIWFERQGVVETLCSLASASVMVRLLLILIAGRELFS